VGFHEEGNMSIIGDVTLPRQVIGYRRFETT